MKELKKNRLLAVVKQLACVNCDYLHSHGYSFQMNWILLLHGRPTYSPEKSKLIISGLTI